MRILMPFIILAGLARGQWLDYPTPNIPRNPNGSAKLDAPVPRRADGRVDFTGIWQSQNRRLIGDLAGEGVLPPNKEVPFQPWAKQLYEQRLQHRGVEAPEARCLPQGVPLLNTLPFPLKFQWAPLGAVILYEGNNLFRQVFMAAPDGDGRDLPQDPNPTWLGYSVGRYDGDDFVIESIGFTERMWLDTYGHPHTEKMRVIERLKRLDFGHMNIEVTIDDPGAYTAPWTVVMKMQYLPDTELMEFACTENNTSLPHLQ